MRTSSLFLAIAAASSLLCACGKSEQSTPDIGTAAGLDAGKAPDAGPAATTRGYSGSASRGDLVVFQIDSAASTYTVHNETTNQDESGTYTTLTNQFAGIKEVTASGKKFFAVELTDKILAANLLVGNAQANISAGISSKLDNTGREAQIAGNYTWIGLTSEPVNGSANIKAWGLLQVDAAGTWKKWDFASGPGAGTPTVTPMAPEEYKGAVPPTGTPQETGTWKVNGASKERLEVTIDGQAGKLTGFANAENDASVFLLDLGTNQGFMLGLKNPAAHYSLAQVAGTYKFVDLWYLPGGPFRGAGHYVLPATGDGSWAHKGDDGLVTTGYLKEIQPCPNIPNMFVVKKMQWGNAANPADDNVIRVVVVGDVVMHFTFASTGAFVSYGVGAKIP